MTKLHDIDTDTDTDAELVERALAGDARASGRLARRHIDAVREVFARRIAAADTVDDLTQATMLGCFARLSTLSRPECFRPWVLAIARNRLHDHFRSSARSRGRVELVDDPEQYACERSDAPLRAIEVSESADLLATALRQLPQDSQLLLSDFYWRERSRTEIAATLGIPVGTVGSRLSHARKRLGELISAIEFGELGPGQTRRRD
ncbi:MAG: sigma-70 family RNA polymerase sigma factor [Enhygromyxa sp.]